MGRRGRNAPFWLTLCCLLFLMGGCRLTHYKRSEALEWIGEELPGAKVSVSWNYKTRETENGYTDRYWTAHLAGRKDLEFEIISHEFYGAESVTHSLLTTFHTVFGREYFEEFQNTYGGPLQLSEAETRPTAYFQLDGVYQGREELEEFALEAEKFRSFLEEQAVPCVAVFHLSFDDPLALGERDSDTAVGVNTLSDEGELLRAATRRFALYAADYRVGMEQFSDQELRAYIGDSNQKFSLTRPDGTTVTYQDLALSRYRYGMSFGTLFEVLEREGLEPKGSPHLFRFSGVDGSRYEFSYSYHDYPFPQKDGSVELGYYYLKDGEKAPMENWYDCHIDSRALERMTGLTFERHS